MENCSNCYFALLCSESCKNQHLKHGCITHKKHNTIMQKNKNCFGVKNVTEEKPYLLSLHSHYSEKSSMNIASLSI